MGDIASASQLKRALSERQRTVSELINEIQSEEEELHEPLTPILGNSPVLENSDNSQFFPSPQPGKKKNDYECFGRWHAERAKAITNQQKSTVLAVCTL